MEVVSAGAVDVRVSSPSATAIHSVINRLRHLAAASRRTSWIVLAGLVGTLLGGAFLFFNVTSLTERDRSRDLEEKKSRYADAEAAMQGAAADVAKYERQLNADEIALDEDRKARDAWTKQRFLLISRRSEAEADLEAATKMKTWRAWARMDRTRRATVDNLDLGNKEQLQKEADAALNSWLEEAATIAPTLHDRYQSAKRKVDDLVDLADDDGMTKRRRIESVDQELKSARNRLNTLQASLLTAKLDVAKGVIDDKFADKRFWSNLAVRIAITSILLILVQILASLHRYALRSAAAYEAQANVLELTATSGVALPSLAALHRMMGAVVEFGRVPAAPSREIIKSITDLTNAAGGTDKLRV